MKKYILKPITLIIYMILMPCIISCGAPEGGGTITGTNLAPPDDDDELGKIELEFLDSSEIQEGNGSNDDKAANATSESGGNLVNFLKGGGPVILSCATKKTKIKVELEIKGATSGKELEWKATGLSSDKLKFDGGDPDDEDKSGIINDGTNKISFTIETVGNVAEDTGNTVEITCMYKDESNADTKAGKIKFNIKSAKESVQEARLREQQEARLREQQEEKEEQKKEEQKKEEQKKEEQKKEEQKKEYKKEYDEKVKELDKEEKEKKEKLDIEEGKLTSDKNTALLINYQSKADEIQVEIDKIKTKILELHNEYDILKKLAKQEYDNKVNDLNLP